LGNVHLTDIKDILADQRIQQMKSSMIDDHSVNNCRACHTLENSGIDGQEYGYLRNMYNEMFVDQEINYVDTTQFKLGAVDLHWSGICDLKCITCWAKQSSSIAIEQGLPIQHIKTDIALKLIDFITDNQSTLQEVYLSGGEPTLIKYNLNLLQKLDKRKDLLIRVNSNMMWDQNNSIVQEILKFPKVMFTCSADNTGKKFEYVRRGADWNKFTENLNYLQQFPNVEIRINSVFFVLSALDLSSTIDYFHNHYNIDNFTINQCSMGHTYYRCRNLPPNIKNITKEHLMVTREKYSHNLNLVGCINNCLQELNEQASESYVHHLELIDQLAGTTWQERFPELL
jgi:organic radical activating enzyme